MKKLTLLVLAMVSAIVVSAQVAPTSQISTDKFNEAGTQLSQEASDAAMSAMKVKASSAKGTDEQWVQTVNAADATYGGDWDYYRFPLFPDSTMLQTYSSGDGAIWTHSVAITLDPTSYMFDLDDTKWNEYTSYTIDSLYFPCIYEHRMTGSTTPDTVVIQISKDHWYYNLDATSSICQAFGVNSMSVPAVLHDEGTWFNSDAEVYATIKVAIDATFAADTNDYGQSAIEIAITDYLPAGITVTEGDVFHTSVSFKPGYTWTPNVSNIADFNEFFMLSFEQFTDALPYYLADRNVSHIMTIQHYEDPTFDAYSPQYFYGADFSFEYHNISAKVTALNTGIEAADAETVSVSQNRPNPFNGTTVVDYNLTNNANVMVEVFNVAGAKVMTINAGAQTAGQHTMTIDGSNLEAGVYYYTFTADAKKITKKMIVY